MRARTFAVVWAVLLAGCGGVFSKNPASDEATSRLDERLLGFWRVDYQASKDDKPEGSRDEAILAVGRRAGSERDLELVMLTLRNDKTLQTARGDVRATTIAGKDYASVQLPPDEKKAGEEAGWFVLRYQLPDADTLRVLAMEEKTVAADVRAGKVAGSVSGKNDARGESVDVTLTASTTVLRAYLEQRGDAVYRPERPLVLRRIRVR